MNYWRPDMWFGVPAHACSGDGCRTCEMYRYYEEGADAMLDALRERGYKWDGDKPIGIFPNDIPTQGCIVFIPDKPGVDYDFEYLDKAPEGVEC